MSPRSEPHDHPAALDLGNHAGPPGNRIRRSGALVLAIAVTQAACLVAGVYAFAGWMRSAVETVVYQQVLDDNLQMTRQLIVVVQLLDVDDLRDNPAAWRRAQAAVGSIELPNDGFVCLTDTRDGRLLCHPSFNGLDGPSDFRYTGGERPDYRGAPGDALLPGNPAVPAVSGGLRDYMGQLQVITAGRMKDIGVSVNVHQNFAGIAARVEGIMAPVFPVGLAVSALLVAATSGLVWMLLRRYECRLARLNAGLEATVDRRTATLRRTRDAVVFGLAKLAESRDTDTGEHLERIGFYVSTLARELTDQRAFITSDYIDDLALASSLHDIGKVAVPDAVLLKPGRFDADERAVMETHAARGGACLDAISAQLGDDDFLQLAREIAHAHHEKWDGTGYPARLTGDAIPFAARLVALADVYDALRSRRPYKDPMPHDRARGILLEGRGTHFDPDVVDAFLAVEDTFRRYADASNATIADGAPPAGIAA